MRHIVGKPLNKGYNFAWELISIKSLHTKLWAPKATRVPTVGISRLPLGNLETKWHLGAIPMAMHIIYYKGEGGGFPQVWAMVNLMSSCLLVAPSCTKAFQLCTNQLVVWFVQVCVNWCLSLFLSPIRSSNMPLYPQSVASQGACSNSLLFR